MAFLVLLLVACGDGRHRLESGAELLLRPDLAKPFQVRVAAWDPVRGNWRLMLRRFQPRIVDQRRLCLIVNDARSPNRVQSHFFRVEGGR